MHKDWRAILLFLILALGSSVLYWATVLHWPKGSLPHAVDLLVWALLRGFGPAFAALIAVWYKEGAAGVRTIFSRLVRWRLSLRWYLLGFCWPIFAIGMGILAAHFFAAMSLRSASNFAPRLIGVFFLMAIVDGPLGEEVGWRGFLLPELLRKQNAAIAGIIVGCVWWTWHIPLYIADGKATLWIPYLFQTIALSLIFTWFFLRTRKSTFFAIFLHNMTNYPIYLSRQFFPQLHHTPVALYVYFAIVIVFGIAALVSTTGLMNKRY